MVIGLTVSRLVGVCSLLSWIVNVLDNWVDVAESIISLGHSIWQQRPVFNLVVFDSRLLAPNQLNGFHSEKNRVNCDNWYDDWRTQHGDWRHRNDCGYWYGCQREDSTAIGAAEVPVVIDWRLANQRLGWIIYCSGLIPAWMDPTGLVARPAVDSRLTQLCHGNGWEVGGPPHATRTVV